MRSLPLPDLPVRQVAACGRAFRGGYNNFTIDELLKPLRQMANLTGLRYHRPIVSHGMIFIPGVYNTREDVEERARAHADRLARHIAGEPAEELPARQAL